MLKFLAKLSIFLLIPILAIGVFVYFSPINLYTYRSWEALSPFLLNFDGPFYPNQHLNMVEVGDLAVRTNYAVSKQVDFITDDYGQRYNGPPLNEVEILIIGDSNIVGSGITQSETLASVLSSQTGFNTYPFYGSINNFLHSEHITNVKPKLILFVRIERRLEPGLCPESLPNQWPDTEVTPMPTGNMEIKIFFDRILREGFYSTQYFRAHRSEKTVIVNKSTGMVFFESSILPPETSTAYIRDTIDSIALCSQWFEQQGMPFVFLPIPDKENIYFDLIPEETKANTDYTRDYFLNTLMTGLQEEQVRVINLLDTYQQARKQGVTPYQLDDTHWNAAGIRLAVTQIATEIE